MTRADRLAALLRQTLRYLPPKLRQQIAGELDKPSHRPREIDRDKVRRLHGKMTVVAIAKELGVTRQAIHAVLREQRDES